MGEWADVARSALTAIMKVVWIHHCSHGVGGRMDEGQTEENSYRKRMTTGNGEAKKIGR